MGEGKTSLLVVGLVRGGAWERDIVKTHDLATGPVSYVSHEAAPGVVGGAGSGVSSTMQMVRSLVGAIREDRPHPNDIEDNGVSFATTMAALESVRSGQPVKVAAEKPRHG